MRSARPHTLCWRLLGTGHTAKSIYQWTASTYNTLQASLVTTASSRWGRRTLTFVPWGVCKHNPTKTHASGFSLESQIYLLSTTLHGTPRLCSCHPAPSAWEQVTFATAHCFLWDDKPLSFPHPFPSTSSIKLIMSLSTHCSWCKGLLQSLWHFISAMSPFTTKEWALPRLNCIHFSSSHSLDSLTASRCSANISHLQGWLDWGVHWSKPSRT